jgi:toxin-antitoxin system PIN domain toxin
MKYLLDVNVLVAWGWADHVDHRRAAGWVAGMRRSRGITLMTSAIPELGFLRVSVQRASGKVSIADAAATLRSMLTSLKSSHQFLSDDLSSTIVLPDWCRMASQSTDAHLLVLAKSHGAELATLDAGIPGGYMIPSS